MQYIPTKQKTIELPVDNFLFITTLALLALWREQSKRASHHTAQPDDNLPVIAF